jgi:predicted NodU family carbamoyl transferase
MNVLGIAGRRHQASAALAVDGAIAAASTEEAYVRMPGVGYDQTGGFPFRAAEACLERAGLAIGDVHELVIVEERIAGEPAPPGDDVDDVDGIGAPAFDDLNGDWRTAVASLPVRRIDPVDADARQCAAATDAGDVLVFSSDPPALVAYRHAEGGLRLQTRVNGVDQLVSATRTLARAVGAAGANPFSAIDRLSVRGDPEFADDMAEVVIWGGPAGIVVDQMALVALTQRVLGGLAPDDALGPMNLKAQQRRHALAASFVERLAAVIRDAARGVCAGERVCLGGSLFAGTRLNTRIQQLSGGAVMIAPVPESTGRAIGAAADMATTESVGGLALGPAFTEAEIKATLDNCRLDYVYEPDWRRLLTRVSKMLSRGMVIGWFQGPMVFGPRSLGTRSVLCDPSMRYARENVNEYLKRRPLDEPLPVSFVPQCADECLSTPVRSPFMLLDAAVKSRWRDKMRAALDHRHELRIHTIMPEQAPELMELLQVHFDRSGVPGLINTTLCGPGEPIACTPRDAVRTVYSSAIDALVIGRFLLMKDYWLLRSDAS